jgi:cytoskeletal protein RodZ
MEIVQVIQDWVGVISLALTGVVWWFVKLNSDKIKANETAKQEVEHTEQERLTTEEKELDLDSRRVEASEKVASDALEHLADTREENLDLLEEVYNLKKSMVALNNKVDDLVEQLNYSNRYICFEEDCSKRRPPLGTYKTKCARNEN